MSEQLNMVKVFEKLNELKSIFDYGKKIIPTLHELVEFIGEIIPLLETVNNSIAESTYQMPQASNHINDVTNATELAATEILDSVDNALDILEKINLEIDNQTKLEEEKDNVVKELNLAVAGNTKAEELLKKYYEYNYSSQKINTFSENLKLINDNLLNITVSLQVQDITSQQLAAVEHLIDSVQSKLISLMGIIKNTDVKKEQPAIKIDNSYEVTFNPDAKYSKSTADQDLADSLIKDYKNKNREIK